MARSVLYLPASNARALEKARTLPCDAVVLDLEDAVAPEAKADARAAAVEAVRSGGFGPRVGVRINGLDTEWGGDDLDALAQIDVGFIVAPKVNDASDTRVVLERLQGTTRLWAMIETPRGLLHMTEIAAVPRVEALMLGVNDLSVALGAGASPDREPMKPWMVMMVATARAYGLLAIDGVFNRFTDAEGFAAECAQGRLYGFDGKSLIHPGQIEGANAAFSPSPEEVDRARALVAAFTLPEAEGKGVIRVDGEMMERLHLAAAERLLARLDPRG
jgi:citrate lyase beta subunit